MEDFPALKGLPTMTGVQWQSYAERNTQTSLLAEVTGYNPQEKGRKRQHYRQCTPRFSCSLCGVNKVDKKYIYHSILSNLFDMNV